jgi:pseudouridine-5'-phosphate glycosidase
MSSLLAFSPEVAAARKAGQPIVALESTIIAHGLPRPRNLETARLLEAEVREAGAVPATIAVADGRLRIGLDAAQLEELAVADGVLKVSRRDLAGCIATGRTGATTVAATMVAAQLAGIRVFATGGIGGVHRGAERDFDVSADLEELARTPVAVVCAGAKSILDLPKTLEVLETKGVAVVGYRTDEFPAFFCRASGLAVPLRLDSVAEIANLLDVQRRLGLTSGVLVVNPIPKAAALPEELVEGAIAEALAVATAAGIGGKQITPFLLARIVELTGGQSVEANVALALSNVRLAAEITVALHALGEPILPTPRIRPRSRQMDAM